MTSSFIYLAGLRWNEVHNLIALRSYSN